MTTLRLAAVFLLCSLAAGQELKSVADFKKPFKVVANLIVDDNFFLLRELTAEEQATGVVNLEDPFDERSRPATTTPAPTTAAPATAAPTRASSRFSQDISGLLPPPPARAAPAAAPAPARRPISGSRRRFIPRTTAAPAPAATTEEEEAAPTTARPLRRGSIRRKVIRVPARRRTTTEAPTTEAPTTEAPTTTELPTTTEAATTAAPRRTPSRRRRPQVNRRVVGTVQPATAAPTAAPTAPPTASPTAPPRAPPAAPATRPAARRRVTAEQVVAQEAARSDAPAAAVASFPGTSRRRAKVEDERENEINALHRRLPGGSKTVVRDMPASDFSCEDRPYGYYADMQANCQVFHICTPIVHPDGFKQNIKHSLFCNNGTRFDQRTLTCREVTLALPCGESDNYYASVKFFEKFNIFDRMRAEDERRRTKIIRRLDTLEDVAALEAQLDE